MAMQWQLRYSVQRFLTFEVFGGKEEYQVLALYPSAACHKKVTIELDRCIKDDVKKLNCLVTKFRGNDGFMEELILAKDATEFTRTLKSLMITENVGFYKEQPLTSTAASPEPVMGLEDIEGEKLNTNDFQAVVETFRSLHPANPQCDPTAVLDSKHKKWRAQCMAAIGLESGKTYFGGTYKEHLAVAVMSQRCYDAALNIMTQCRHPQQSATDVNRALFRQVPGTRDEEALYQALLDFRDGRTGKESFNQTLKFIKQAKTQGEITRKREIDMLKQELKRQQAIVASQAKRIATLEAENLILKADASHGDDEPQRETSDIYEFQSEDLFPVETNLEAELTHDTSEDENTVTGIQQQQVQHFIEYQRKKEETNATIGKLMEGKNKETGMWFKVKVMQKEGSSVKVHWMNYSKQYDSWIETSLLRPIKPKFSEGDMVNARYNVTYRNMYPATVVAVDGDKVLLRYEDGLEKRINQRYVEERN